MSGNERLNRALIRNYRAPGPVAEAFIRDFQHTACGIMGPFGSGKTTAAAIKARLLTMLQPPSLEDGVRRGQGYVIARTYPQLWQKAIPSWAAVFPHCDIWPFQGARNNPAIQIIRGEEPAPIGKWEMIVNFVAVGDDNYEEFALGLLPTWVHIYEANTLPWELIAYLILRLGRYPEPHLRPDGADPEAAMGPVGLIFDFNAPPMSNWTWREGVLRPAHGWKVYIQPGGRDPGAENLAMLEKIRHPDAVRLGISYYEYQARLLNDEHLIARFIDNKPGHSRTGRPVYTAYAEHANVFAQDRPYNPNLKLLIGVDGKGKAAAVFGQHHPVSKLAHRISELVTPADQTSNARDFGKDVKRKVETEFPGLRAGVLAGLDPSLFDPDTNFEGSSWAETFMEASEIPCIPAPTNDIDKRLGVINGQLKTNLDVGDGPRWRANSDGCPLLREAMNGGYRIRKAKAEDDQDLNPSPMKNWASNVADADQYFGFLCDGAAGTLETIILGAARQIEHARGRAPAGDASRYLDHGL